MNMDDTRKRSKTPNLIASAIIVAVVIAICVAGALSNNTDQAIPERLKNGIPLYFFGAFAVAGLITLTNVVITTVRRVKYCTYAVQAVCIGLDSKESSDSDGGSNTVYSPIYEFEYNGEMRTIRNNTYTSASLAPNLGCVNTIHIDAETFSDYYISYPLRGQWVSMIIGVLFSVPSLVLLLAILAQGLGML